LRFGIFLAPFHARSGENPTLALERDLQLVEHLDALGYDEAWIGEHHSAGAEIIAAPEIFIAAAAARTRHIRLGTGVTSVPYHHPLIVADRMVLLDHLTRGRTMLGIGPGALPSDAHMMGIDPLEQRGMMEEGLEAIIALLDSEEPVTRKTSWFTLQDARLQLRPYTRPRFEIGVAAIVSPSGPRAAARFDCSLLSIGATTEAGFDMLGLHWNVMEEVSADYGRSPDRGRWRLVAPMHIAESREQARADVRFGLWEWFDYMSNVAALPLAPPGFEGTSADDLVDLFVNMGLCAVGTPDDAIAIIERLEAQSGGFGTFLLMAHEWADRPQTLRSYELLARYVMPHFQGSNASLAESSRWARSRHGDFQGQMGAAIQKATESHQAERDAKRAT
jgi:limonene 1,2-monooxygenase